MLKLEYLVALLVDCLLVYVNLQFVKSLWEVAYSFPTHSAVLIVVATWVLFGWAMRMQQLKDEGKLEWKNHPFRRGLAVLIFPFALLFDVASNVIYSFLCLEFPRWIKLEFLLTQRLCRHYDGSKNWRSVMAHAIGYEFLDDVDPSGVHVD